MQQFFNSMNHSVFAAIAKQGLAFGRHSSAAPLVLPGIILLLLLPLLLLLLPLPPPPSPYPPTQGPGK
jgi:hypothetical protein